jgi:hypothetical protein
MRSVKSSRRWTATVARHSVLLATVSSTCLVAAPAQTDEQLKDLIVVVNSVFNGNPKLGAGIIFGTEADRVYILTANHNVRHGVGTEQTQADEVQVQFKWRPGETLKAKLLNSFDDNLDLAVLVATASTGGSLHFDWLGNSASLDRGAPVYFIGHPKGNLWEMTVKPAAISKKETARIYFQSDYVAPGNSGGALVSENKELIGMVRKDDPPYGEAVSIEAILQWLERYDYPILLTRPGSPDSLSALEAKIQDDVKYDCLLLTLWPNQSSAPQVLKDLSGPIKSVEENPRFSHSRSVVIGRLYRCYGGAYLNSGNIAAQIPAALPYLSRSLEFDPSQALLKQNVETLETINRNQGGDIKVLITTLLQVLRGGNDPDIPALTEKIAGVIQGPEWQAKSWFLNEATSPSILEMLELQRLRIKKELGKDLSLDITTSTLANGLIEVKATLGPNIFLWDVDYNGKQFTPQNDISKVITDSVKRKQ